MDKFALIVENLTKIYLNSKTEKQNKALNEISFGVEQGEVFGLLGPNGAGKTTFLSILGGTVAKTSGKVNVWGFDLDKSPRQVKASLGIVPQEINLDAFFSPKQLLELQAGLYGIAKKDNPKNITKWLKNYGNPFDKIGLDNDGISSIEWGVYGLPETFLINKDNKILYKHIGPIMKNDLEKINAFLK